MFLRGMLQWSLTCWSLRFDKIPYHGLSGASYFIPKHRSRNRVSPQETNLHPQSRLSWQEKVCLGQTNQSGLAPSICFGIMILSLWLPARSIRWSKRRSLKEEPTFPSGKDENVKKKTNSGVAPASFFFFLMVSSTALVLSSGHAGPFVTPAQWECNDSIKLQSIVVSAAGWCIDRAPVRRRRARGEGGV